MRWLAMPWLLSVGLLTVATASSAPWHYPASNGWIVFTSDRDVNSVAPFRLYRLEPVGGGVKPLGQLRGRQPAWSPDGSLIAFVDSKRRLVVAGADGFRRKTLTSGRYPVQNPSWSPDGSRIVVEQSGRGRSRGDLVIVATNGSGLTRITSSRHDDREPAWAPDGVRIAFASNRPVAGLDDYEISLVRPDAEGVRRLTANVVEDRSPSWSPDGSLIAFESGRDLNRYNPELWTMRSDGGGERRVQLASDPSGFPSWADMNPAWSPDGNWLVYVSNGTFYPENVFIVRPDGQDKTDLTPETRSLDLDPAWQPVCSHPGTRGGDRLRGTNVDDRLCGFLGDDTISGGAGRDGLYGGEGADVLRSRDGSFDIVGCGAGLDEVVADRADLVGIDCERVTRR